MEFLSISVYLPNQIRMMMKKILLAVITASVVMSGCSIQQTIEKAELEKEAELCIVENSAVRKGFLAEFKTVLTSMNIPHRMVNASSIPASCEWTTTYVARWTWDLALYMSYAEIKVFRQGNLDGEAIYDSTHGGANMSKFIDAETKIRELVNELMQFKTSSLFGLFYSQG